jgi:Uma2 family endonuclease
MPRLPFYSRNHVGLDFPPPSGTMTRNVAGGKRTGTAEMSAISFFDIPVRIPAWVADRLSFRRWLNSDTFPEVGRISFLVGEVWVDMSKEQIFTHNQVKQEYNLVLGGLAKKEKRGRYFPDGAYLSNAEADFTAQPDGTFVSWDAFHSGRVRLVEGTRHGFLELEGSPDMVLEIVSDSSVAKDNTRMPELYWQAEIKEYWLIDVRGQRLRFDIFRHTPRAYVAVRGRAGWIKSTVFEKSFKLTRHLDEFDNPEYTLAVR